MKPGVIHQVAGGFKDPTRLRLQELFVRGVFGELSRELVLLRNGIEAAVRDYIQVHLRHQDTK